MKYINHAQLGIITFGDHINHSDMAQKIGGNITSAGFVHATDIYCLGKSISLNLHADPSDSIIIRSYMDPI